MDEIAQKKIDLLKAQLVRFEKHIVRALKSRPLQISWPHIRNLERLVSETKNELNQITEENTMKYISRVVEIEAERITKANHIGAHNNRVETETGRDTHIVSNEPVCVGDFLNVTDEENIYHMPAKIIDGPNAKYEKVE